jgi:hypothetical protein
MMFFGQYTLAGKISYGDPDQVLFTMGYACRTTSVTPKLVLLFASEIVFGKYFTQHWK